MLKEEEERKRKAIESRLAAARKDIKKPLQSIKS